MALSCVALAALFLGMNIGYFVVLWIEWGAILGGLALTGSIFLVPATGRWIQGFREFLLVAGLALAGAGVSDILDFPGSNSDIYPGLLAGIVCGFVFVWITWRDGLARALLSTLFNTSGEFFALLLALLGIELFSLAGMANKYGLTINVADLLAGLSSIAILLYHLKQHGARMTRDAVWITFIAMLFFCLLLSLVITTEFLIPDAAIIGLGSFLIVGLPLWGWKYVCKPKEASASGNFTLKAHRLLTLGYMGVVLLPLAYFYLQALNNLETNISPTQLVAQDKTFFKLGNEAFISLMMRDIYLLGDLQEAKQNVSMSRDDTPATFIKKLARDRWSYAGTVEDRTNWEEGIENGVGYSFIRQFGKFIIGYVNRDSPAASAGYERGDQFVIRDQVETGTKKRLILKPSGETVPDNLQPEKYKADIVRHKIIQRDGANIGYLWLLNFSNATHPLIQEAFKEFKQQGVEELVLDLRYNGGGHPGILLADLIAGGRHDGSVYYFNGYIRKYGDRNDVVRLAKQPLSIPIKRVFVLTTHMTCSASELIINGLRPYLPVITIGEKTCGKPFFMEPISYGGNVYLPVTGMVFNSKAKADYLNGIEPDCKITEDFLYPVEEPGDKLLDAALYFQKHNACPAEAL